MASKKQQKRKVAEEVDESFAPLVLESKPKKGKMNNANATDNSNDNLVDDVIDGNGSNRMVIIEHCKSW